MNPDCHDFFISGGRHVGRYEEMYRLCDDPWDIEKLGPRLDMRAALLLLEGRLAPVGRFLDVGGGLGLFSGLLAAEVWRANPGARGVINDIAPSAAARAGRRLADPRLDFQVSDARGWDLAPPWPDGSFDLAVLAQVLWGLLENLDGTLAALARLLPAGGLFLVSQHFPANQTYGREKVAGPEDLARRLTAAGLEILDSLETNRAVNHHWAAVARKK